MLCRQQQPCVAGARFVHSDVRYQYEAAVCIAGASAAWDPIRPVLHPGPGRPSKSQDEQQAQVPPSSYQLLSSCLVLFSMADGKAHLSLTLDQLSGNARCPLMQESITVSLKESGAQTGRALYGMCKRSEQWCGIKSYNFHLLNSSDVACMEALLRLDAISMAACDIFCSIIAQPEHSARSSKLDTACHLQKWSSNITVRAPSGVTFGLRWRSFAGSAGLTSYCSGTMNACRQR